MATDKKTIGLTPRGNRLMDSLMAQDLFKDQMEAARFAMAYAIAKGAKTGVVEGADTKWSVGGFDPSGEVRNIVAVTMKDTVTPYRATEFLIDAGLALLEPKIGDGKILDLNTIKLES